MTTPQHELETIQYNPSELTTYHRNPRRGNIDAIAESLNTNGQYRAIVVNLGRKTGRPLEVLAGNHTLQAAKQLGWDTITATTIDVNDQQAARIVAADNRTADLGDYDTDQLADLLRDLDTLEGTGYTDDDLTDLLDALEDAKEEPALTDEDDAPEKPADPISKTGDIWHLGPHSLLVGDATDTPAIKAFLGESQPSVVWTDPPYGVNYVGRTKEALTIQNDGAEGLANLLAGAFAAIVQVAREGAPIYVAHADAERITFETAMREAGILVRQNLIWVKNSLVMGRSDYHYRHEPILYGFTPGGSGRLGRGGPRWYGDDAQTTVFDVEKPSRNSDHPTMKPVALIAAMLANSARRGDIVFDPFAGSGSTMIAAHQQGLLARLVELDPVYCDVICRRWQEHTGQAPHRDGDPHPTNF